MNKFSILSCVNVNEKEYDGPCVILVCESDPSFMLFFPMTEENGKIITYVMNDNNDYDINTNILGIYRTMVDSWNSADRYLAGIIMDSGYEENEDKSELIIRLALADKIGFIDSLVRVNFLHAILLAAMEKVPIIVSDDLIDRMLPTIGLDEDEDDDEEEDNLLDKKDLHRLSKNKIGLHPEDKDIVDIAKKIMSGKIKEQKHNKDDKNNDNKNDKKNDKKTDF
jgi:Mg-chelatase subunit ChlI